MEGTKLSEETKKRAFLGIWFDYENKKTYTFFNYTGNFIEKKYDFIWSKNSFIAGFSCFQ